MVGVSIRVGVSRIVLDVMGDIEGFGFSSIEVIFVILGCCF